MSVLDPTARSHAERYLTAELVTLRRDGTPVSWPTVPLIRPDGSILITTSVAFPSKALNIRRDPRVAVLFSSPVGTGMTDPPQLLVRGEAECPEQVHVEPEGDLGVFWQNLFRRQPSARQLVRPPLRGLLSWYFMRLVITVHPREIEFAAMPAPGPSGTSTAALIGGGTVAHFPSAVLAARDQDGDPVLRRITVRADGDRYQLHLPAGSTVTPGPASLLVHRHDERLSDMHNAVVTGVLQGADTEGWYLVPDRLIEPAGSDSFTSRIAAAHQLRATAHRYLRRRGLPLPTVPWAQYRALDRGERSASVQRLAVGASPGRPVAKRESRA